MPRPFSRIFRLSLGALPAVLVVASACGQAPRAPHVNIAPVAIGAGCSFDAPGLLFTGGVYDTSSTQPYQLAFVVDADDAAAVVLAAARVFFGDGARDLEIVGASRAHPRETALSAGTVDNAQLVPRPTFAPAITPDEARALADLDLARVDVHVALAGVAHVDESVARLRDGPTIVTHAIPFASNEVVASVTLCAGCLTTTPSCPAGEAPVANAEVCNPGQDVLSFVCAR